MPASDPRPADDNLARLGPEVTAPETRPVDREVRTAPEPRADARDPEVPIVGGESATIDRDLSVLDLPEAALGGADAVPKTTFGVGHGTEPDGRAEFAPVGRRKGEGPVVAATDAGGGLSPIAWIVGLLAVLAAVVYGAGMLTG
jgi:hypothetical protein